MSLKLYKIETQGNNTFYAVALDPTTAYQLVRNALDDWDWHAISDRELKTITLVADNAQYGDCGANLFLDVGDGSLL